MNAQAKTRLQVFREKYPAYNDLSDEELARGLYKRFYSDLPEADVYREFGLTFDDPSFGTQNLAEASIAENAAKMTPEVLALDPDLEPTVPGYIGETGKAIVRGFGSGVLSAGAGLAELADAGTDFFGFEDLIDSGDENFLINLANQGKQSIDENLGVGDAYKDAYIVKVGEAVGSIGSLFAFGGVGGLLGRAASGAKAAGLLGKVGAGGATGAAGAGLGASEQVARIEEARSRGIEVSDEDADIAILAGGLVGTTESLVPLGQLKKIRGLKTPERNIKELKKRLDAANEAGDERLATEIYNRLLREVRYEKAAKSSLEAVRSAVKTGSQEAIQEAVASVAQDAIQNYTYDDSVSFTDSLWDDLTVGFGAGATVDAITTGLFNRRARISRQIEQQKEAELRVKEEESRQFFLDQADAAKEKLRQQEIAAQEEAEANLRKDARDRRLAGEMAAIEAGREAERQRQRTYEDLVESQQGRGETSLTGKAQDYARRLARNVTSKGGQFPDAGTFSIDQRTTPDGVEFFAKHSISDEVYGSGSPIYEETAHLVSNLNNEIINRRVNQSIIDAMDLSPEPYSPEQSESLYAIGQRLNRPDRFTITASSLNQAAGTIDTPKTPFAEGVSIDRLHEMQYGVPPLTDRGKKIYKDLTGLTAAQKINFERRKKGLKEVSNFDLQEAREVLGEDFPKVFDVLLDAKTSDINAPIREFGQVGAKLKTKREIGQILRDKNITSGLETPEVEYIFDKIVNEKDVNKMTPSQGEFLASELRQLPRLPTPTNIPDFRPKPYTRKQYDEAQAFVIESGDGTLQNIESFLSDQGSEKRIGVVANAIRNDLKKAGTIREDDTVAVTPLLEDQRPVAAPIEKVPFTSTQKRDEDALLKDLQESVDKELTGLGLSDIKGRVLDVLKFGPVTREGEVVLGDFERELSADTTGYFLPSARTIFTAIDRAKRKSRDNSPESLRASIMDTLDHEVLHATRELDLWEDKEWRLLENLARKKTVPGKPNVTFYQSIIDNPGYQNLSPVGKMEEAVAELIRSGRKDKAMIAGKPRAMVERMFNFFEKTNNALRGTGFQSFEDVLDRLESGEVGARERGKVRTLRSLEKSLLAVPERGIGRERDVAPDFIEDPSDEPLFQRRPSTTPIESAVRLANKKYNDYNTAVEDEFFGKFWPSLMSEVGGTVSSDKVRTASKRAIRDIEDFIKENPKYRDYYAEDLSATRSALESRYGQITDDDLLFYQVANGLTSPATSLPANVGDALKIFDLYKQKGNLDDIELGLSAKGNRVIKSAPFTISGTTSATKAKSLKVIDELISNFSNSPTPVKSAIDFLKEGVSVKELQDFNRQMGYKSNVSNIGAIKSLVKQATGQDQEIPRMFIFGKKIGAYTLNLAGDPRYTTIDVWESRFIRSYFNNLFERNTGLPANVEEDALFQDFSKIFKEEYDKLSGVQADPASLQAMRWFYMIDAAKKAGYRGASTSETISEITNRYINRDGRTSEARRREGDAEIVEEIRSPSQEVNDQRDQDLVLKTDEAADLYVDSLKERNDVDSPLYSLDQTPEIRKPLKESEARGEPPLSIQSGTYSIGDKIIYQLQDKFIGLKKAVADVNKYRRSLGLSNIPPELDPYIGEESIPGKLGQKFREFKQNRLEPLANKIADNNFSTDEVDEFLILRHEIERNKRIQQRNPQTDPETNPGSGKLQTGEALTDSFVKKRMMDRYGLSWDDATQTWSGGNKRTKKLLDIAADFDQINRESNLELLRGGLIDQDGFDYIDNLYKYYAPLSGKDPDEDAAEAAIIGSSMSTKGKEYLTAKGRTSAAQSPLGHAMFNAERSIARSLKNKEFGQKLLNLVRENPDADYWRVIGPGDPEYVRALESKLTYVGSDPALQNQKYSSVPPGQNPKDFIRQVVFKPDNLGKAFNKEFIGVKENGQQYYVFLKDKRLREAIASFDVGTVDNLFTKFGIVNRYLSMVNTSLNPEFVVGNFTKDLQTAIFNILGEQNMSQGKAKDQALISKVIKDVIPSMGAFYKGLRRYDSKTNTVNPALLAKEFFTGMSPKDQADFNEFTSAGAKADWFHTRPPEEQVKTINDMINMSRGTFFGSFKKRYDAVLQFVEDTNSAVENAVRFATFKASRDELIDSGIPRDRAVAQAASLAKNLTINFNRRGMQGEIVNAIYLFFNASVQGTANFARGLFGPKGNPFSKEASRVKQAAIGGLITMGALSALRAEEESEENPETGRSYYSEIPDYIKERNMVIMAEPNIARTEGASNIYVDDDGNEYEGKQYYYTVPLPYGYNVFHVLGQNIFEMTQDHISPTKAAGNVTSAFMGSFSPIGFSGISSLAPTASQPFVEVARNKNFFGGPIYREPDLIPGQAPFPESSLAFGSTRQPFIDTAKTLNALFGEGSENVPGYIDISPDILEHFYEFILGGAGTFAIRSATAFDKYAKDEDLLPSEKPFLRRLKGETNASESQADFFERSNRIEQRSRQLEILRGQERVDYRREHGDQLAMLSRLKLAKKQIRELRQRIKVAKQRAALSPENALKYGKLEQDLFDRIDSIYNKFNKAYDSRVGRTKI